MEIARIEPVTAEGAIQNTPEITIGELGPIVFIQLQKGDSLVTAASAIVESAPHAAGDAAEMPAIATSLEELFSDHISRDSNPRVDIEGRVPGVEHEGYLRPGTVDYYLNAADLGHAAREYGEPGVLACLAVAHGCELAGEDDGPIMVALRKQFGQVAMEKYLTWRQVTNYYIVTPDSRLPLEEYIEQHVTKRYNAYFAEALGVPDFAEFTIEGAMVGIRESLNEVGLDLENAADSVIKAHFERHSLIEGAVAATSEGVQLTDVQRLVVAFNLLRDRAFAAKLWNTSEETGVFMVMGPAHIDAMVAELYRREIVSPEEYTYYLGLMRRLGRSAVAWVRQASPTAVSMIEISPLALPDRRQLVELTTA